MHPGAGYRISSFFYIGLPYALGELARQNEEGKTGAMKEALPLI